MSELSKNARREEAIRIIQKELDLDRSTIRQMGIGPLLTQVASKKGMSGVTKCDADSGDTGQYYGDLLKDLK